MATTYLPATKSIELSYDDLPPMMSEARLDRYERLVHCPLTEEEAETIQAARDAHARSLRFARRRRRSA